MAAAYRDPIPALEHKLRSLLDERRELDASIAETRRALRRGRWRRSWVELVVPAAFGLLFVVAGSCLFLPLHSHSCPPSSETMVRAIKGAAELYVARGGDCPTVEALIDRGLLDLDQPPTDAWERPFRIECHDDRIVVRSAGPDGRFGSDDIEVGRLDAR